MYLKLKKRLFNFNTYIINLELSDDRQIQYACPSCLSRVAILDLRSGSINCLAISSFYDIINTLYTYI